MFRPYECHTVDVDRAIVSITFLCSQRNMIPKFSLVCGRIDIEKWVSFMFFGL